VYGILIDTAIQLLFVVAGALALRWYFAASDRAKTRRTQVIAKTLERLDTITKPLNLEKIHDGGAAVRFMRQKFATEDRRKLIAMVQMAERVAQGMVAAAKRPQNDYVSQSPNLRTFRRRDIAIGGRSQRPNF
jgi:hypothetical protein